MVDGQGNERGIGAELRTDGHASIRAAKGVFISADAQAGANGQQLEMQAAIDQLQQRLQEVQAMADAARIAGAIAADFQAQQALFDDTLNQLRQAGLLISAPDGIGVTSGSHLQMSAKENLIATAGGHLDIGVGKTLTVAAGEAVSLFAQQHGAKFIAAQGKVDIQAQNGEMSLAAQKDVTVTSGAKLQLAAAEEIWLCAGGSYIKITATGIESGTPGDIRREGCVLGKAGAGVNDDSHQPLRPPRHPTSIGRRRTYLFRLTRVTATLSLLLRKAPMLISSPFLHPDRTGAAHPDDDAQFIDDAMPNVVAYHGLSGNFPISYNLGWHGGRHIGANLDGTIVPVRAIADGVLCYRREPTKKPHRRRRAQEPSAQLSRSLDGRRCSHPPTHHRDW